MSDDQRKPHIMEMESTLVPIALFAAIFGIIYISVTAKHRQRMAMIDKGLSPADLAERSDPFRSLKSGMVAMGVGVGLLIGYIIQYTTHNDDPMPYFILVTICGGAALIGHYFIVRHKQLG
ncbi:MAG TPA: hypothetical protein PLB89_17255 [Flavobacteriales bacterium]|nr:hypothetical protein [Flavobacteriales bacterium]